MSMCYDGCSFWFVNIVLIALISTETKENANRKYARIMYAHLHTKLAQSTRRHNGKRAIVHVYWLNHWIEGIQLKSIQKCLFLVCMYLFNRLVIFISSILKMKGSFVIWNIMKESTIKIWLIEIEKSFFFGINVMSMIFSSNSLRFCLRMNIQMLPFASSVITCFFLLARITNDNHASGLILRCKE